MKPIKADAEGKPLGRVGDEIPLSGRIVAIADVFDALCSKRVYKEPWSDDQVFEEIRKIRGTKFDPEVVDVFFDILPEIKRIRNFYIEEDNAEVPSKEFDN
jgi:response regulator RpfG family c-di-GMP phosphodiesterase